MVLRPGPANCCPVADQEGGGAGVVLDAQRRGRGERGGEVQVGGGGEVGGGAEVGEVPLVAEPLAVVGAQRHDRGVAGLVFTKRDVLLAGEVDARGEAAGEEAERLVVERQAAREPVQVLMVEVGLVAHRHVVAVVAVQELAAEAVVAGAAPMLGQEARAPELNPLGDAAEAVADQAVARVGVAHVHGQTQIVGELGLDVGAQVELLLPVVVQDSGFVRVGARKEVAGVRGAAAKAGAVGLHDARRVDLVAEPVVVVQHVQRVDLPAGRVRPVVVVAHLALRVGHPVGALADHHVDPRAALLAAFGDDVDDAARGLRAVQRRRRRALQHLDPFDLLRVQARENGAHAGVVAEGVAGGLVVVGAHAVDVDERLAVEREGGRAPDAHARTLPHHASAHHVDAGGAPAQQGLHVLHGRQLGDGRGFDGAHRVADRAPPGPAGHAGDHDLVQREGLLGEHEVLHERLVGRDGDGQVDGRVSHPLGAQGLRAVGHVLNQVAAVRVGEAAQPRAHHGHLHGRQRLAGSRVGDRARDGSLHGDGARVHFGVGHLQNRRGLRVEGSRLGRDRRGEAGQQEKGNDEGFHGDLPGVRELRLRWDLPSTATPKRLGRRFLIVGRGLPHRKRDCPRRRALSLRAGARSPRRRWSPAPGSRGCSGDPPSGGCRTE